MKICENENLKIVENFTHVSRYQPILRSSKKEMKLCLKIVVLQLAIIILLMLRRVRLSPYSS